MAFPSSSFATNSSHLLAMAAWGVLEEEEEDLLLLEAEEGEVYGVGAC